MSGVLPGMSGEEPSDGDAVARVRAGDTAAYEILYTRHVAAARSLARHLLSNGAEVEDVVSDTFTRLLDVLRRGGGPDEGFRPYLLTSVRRAAYDRLRAGRRVSSTDQIEVLMQGTPAVDPAVEDFDRSMIVKAFQSLPDRWRTVLWHTEVEGEKPAAVGPLLGLSSGGVAALAYRAREGLRQAYLQMHLASTRTGAAAAARAAGSLVPAAAGPRPECRPALDKLGAYVRGGLAGREKARVRHHLNHCPDCQAIYAELADINGSLRTAVGPLVLGAATSAYLGATAKGGAAGILTWFRHLPKRQQQALSAGAAAAAALAVLALVLAGHPAPPPARPHARPPAALPHPSRPATPQHRAPKPPAPNVPPVVAPPARHKAPPPAARLTASIAPVGALLRGQSGVYALQVDNQGASRSGPVTADVALPPGVTYNVGTDGREAAGFVDMLTPGEGWSCLPRQAVLRCARGPLGPHQATRAYLGVTVAESAPLGAPVDVRLRSGADTTTAAAATGVTASGLPVGYVANGHVDAFTAGNAAMSCPLWEPGCASALHREGDRRDDADWCMIPVDEDDEPLAFDSSSAMVPLRGRVLWAGLYWSGVAPWGADQDDEGQVRLRPPGAASFTAVQAGTLTPEPLGSRTAYQAYADVTSLVSTYGAGRWEAAGIVSAPGVGHYAGWSLVVVTSDPAAPSRQVMVLNGPEPVIPGSPPVRVPLDGLTSSTAPANLSILAWNGDPDGTGEKAELDGVPLTPGGGDHNPDEVFSSWSEGAIGPPLTFGIDVDPFSAVLPGSAALSFQTGNNIYLVGAVTVVSPTAG